MRGELAEHWERDGDAGWLFHLRDASFHNGSPVTADDVKWTLEQVAGEKSTAYMRGQFRGVDRIETPDARTVRIIMKQPTVTLPIWLAAYEMPIVAKGTLERNGAGVGCGPFVLQSQERGVVADLAAFDKFYRPGLPKLKAVDVVVYADETARVAALQSGDVDLIEYVPWQSMAGIEADPKLKLENTDGPFMYVTFNGGAAPFNDPRVRLAVAHAINREEIVKSVFFGRGERWKACRSSPKARSTTTRWPMPGPSTRPRPSSCWRRRATRTASAARCCPPRSTACTRTRRC